MIIQNLILFIISILFLVKSGSWLVKSLSKLANFLRLSEFAIAFILMTFATSTPELFVGITSALVKNPTLSLGTVIGSNIANLTLIIGIVIILGRGLKIESKLIQEDIFIMFLITLLPLLLMLDKTLSRVDAIFLLMVLVIYVVKIVKERRISTEADEEVHFTEVFKHFGIFFLSVFLLIFSADFVVRYATLLSLELAIPSILIGIFLVAVGTSMPELVFETKAILSGHSSMVLGNVIGSVVVNTTLVLGATALIHPIEPDITVFISSILFMIFIALIFMMFARTDRYLTWKEGVTLLFIYAVFVIVELSIKGVIG